MFSRAVRLSYSHGSGRRGLEAGDCPAFRGRAGGSGFAGCWKLYQKLGFAYLRDGGDRWGVGAKARSLAGEYGITYRTPLSPLCAQGHYGGFIGEKYENLSEYAAKVYSESGRKARILSKS